MRLSLISTCILTAVLGLSACSGDAKKSEASKAAPEAAAAQAADAVKFDGARLSAVLAAQDDKAKARYDARNPQATLEFFGITPGMTVMEALPGGGWYTKILLPYLGDTGQLYGVDYAAAMWSNFGFADADFLKTKETWAADWSARARAWSPEGAPVSAFTFADMPESVNGTVDAVIFIRALHNLSRFESKGQFMTEALATSYTALKPGGILAVVQHRGPESADAAWADGSAGYLKQSDLIAKIEAAGFKLLDTSEINANPKDQPGSDDVVWRLPPSLRGSDDTKEARAAIGESDRMTLKFIKPAE